MITAEISTLDIVVPDNISATAALKRITHMGIGAHANDLEFMAFHGIAQCFSSDQKWFGGVTCTNGAGSARSGRFSNYSDYEMIAIRREEQNAAAKLGNYGAMIHLNLLSAVIKRSGDTTLKDTLRKILGSGSPGIVYTHNLADKHETHIAVAIAALQAMRELPPTHRPKQVWGCEVWRDLDWLPDQDKVVMDVSDFEDLATALATAFVSRIGGGKRYDAAIIGRRAANATFLESHATDKMSQAVFAMDLTPLVADETLDIVEFVCGFVENFEEDVRQKLRRQLGR
jgi:LmbE family N-acetylglucosaminyl deacetylase